MTRQLNANLSLSTLALAAWIIVSLILMTCTSINDQDLWFSDEPRVAGIVVQMADSGVHSVPYIGIEPFVEKPPLYHQVAASSYRLAGKPDNPMPILRLTTLAWGLLTLWLAFHYTTLLLRHDKQGSTVATGPQGAAWASVAVLASCPGFLGNALTIRVDIALVCTFMASLLCAYQWIFHQRLVALYGGAIALFLAFFAKKIIGPLLVTASLLGLGGRHWHRYRWHYLGAMTLFLIPVAVWVTLLYPHGGYELFAHWLIDNHFKRFQGGGTLHNEKPGDYTYYLRNVFQYLSLWAIFLIGWLTWLAGQLINRRRIPVADRILLLAILLPMALLSIATTKRPVYLLPLLPLYAVAIAVFLCRLQSDQLQRVARGLATICIALIVILSLLSLLPVTIGGLERYLVHWSSSQALGFMVAGIVIGRLAWQQRAAWQSLSAGILLLLTGIACIHYPASNDERGQHEQLQSFIARIEPGLLSQSAGYGISREHSLAGDLYAFTHQRFDELSEEQASAVLRGEDLRYRCVLYRDTTELELPPHQRVASVGGAQRNFPDLALNCRDEGSDEDHRGLAPNESSDTYTEANADE